MLRPRLLRIPFACIGKRNLHVPPLAANFPNGIPQYPDFLSPQAVHIAYTEYQTLMVNRLNDQIAGTSFENKDPKELAIQFAREPKSAATFNYASMAHNNHFFFDCLAMGKTEMPESLKKGLEESFSSIETLRREFILTANAMFGPGFVWLVARTAEPSAAFYTRTSQYALLTTYLAGSPYPAAHWRRQSIDQNTQGEPFHAREKLMNSNPVNTVGSMGQLSEDGSKYRPLPGGFQRANSLIPLLCINTWEHVWLPDYGVAGKFEYAERWWERIDWDRVASRELPKLV